MRKKKADKEQPPRTGSGFSHAPFTTLKGLSTRPPSGKEPLRREPRSTPAGEEEDAELFLRAVGGAKGPRGRSSARNSDRSPAAEHARQDQDRKIFLDALSTLRTSPLQKPAQEEREEAIEDRHRSAPGRMRQVRRGTVRIAAELDLHGYVREEALARLEHFIGDAARLGHEAVLVITGKGVHSPEGPVLQGAVAHWLSGKGKGRVSEFFAAPRDRGGNGAYVVFLKRKQDRR